MSPFSAFILRPRLLIGIAVALAVGLAVPGSVPFWTRCLMGYCSGVVLYMVLIVWSLSRISLERMREMASKLDDSALIILVFALVATSASFGAIADLLFASSAPIASRVGDIVLGGATMVLSWMFVQVVFTVHYAHMFYGDVNGSERGGLQFGGNEDEPDFWDFLYFTTSIGATAQTSDTVLTSRTMRRIATTQAVYSFFFNTAVLALAINIAAGLAGH